jgi:hypothetical protein
MPLMADIKSVMGFFILFKLDQNHHTDRKTGRKYEKGPIEMNFS